jgi:hypothetical protein
MHVVGWLCALGIGLMIFDLVRFLPELPNTGGVQKSRRNSSGMGSSLTFA